MIKRALAPCILVKQARCIGTSTNISSGADVTVRHIVTMEIIIDVILLVTLQCCLQSARPDFATKVKWQMLADVNAGSIVYNVNNFKVKKGP